MKRKKRRQEQAQAQHGPPPPKTGVYRPFQDLQQKLPPPAPAPPPRRRIVPPAAPPPEERERASFESAMAGVAPLERDHVPSRRSVPPPPPVEDELEAAERFLAAMVQGDVPFDFTGTDEYLEGKVQGLDARLVQKLRRGEYAVEGHIDLHGLDRHEARVALRDFLERAQADGRRCVLVVHGRGLGSPDGIPVLRERMKDWLSRGSIGRRVLAFASARPVDGGTGAVYVLLRR
ncbi:MAG: DNA mismatch repair protein MutS [Myxococcales bacterium]|nr:DNA mismatch repair protein MutS [Myxococcales bacterium]